MFCRSLSFNWGQIITILNNRTKHKPAMATQLKKIFPKWPKFWYFNGIHILLCWYRHMAFNNGEIRTSWTKSVSTTDGADLPNHHSCTSDSPWQPLYSVSSAQRSACLPPWWNVTLCSSYTKIAKCSFNIYSIFARDCWEWQLCSIVDKHGPQGAWSATDSQLESSLAG